MNSLQKIACLLLLLPTLAWAEGDDTTWNTTLKSQFFAGKALEESMP